MSAALRQRCLIHRRPATWYRRSGPTPESAAWPAQARLPASNQDRWSRSPAAALSPAALRSLLSRLRTARPLPAGRERWTRVGHSNFIERTRRRDRRRADVIGRLPGEISCVALGVGRAQGFSRGNWGCYRATADYGACTPRAHVPVTTLEVHTHA